MDRAGAAHGREVTGRGWLSDRSDRDHAPDWGARIRMSGGAGEGRFGQRRHRRPNITRTPVQSGNPTASREGARLQFVAFDAPYLERLQRGDAGTEQHFAAYFGELIQLKLRSRLRSKEAVEDGRQETFVREVALVR